MRRLSRIIHVAGALAACAALRAGRADGQQAQLVGRSVLPAGTYRAGSPPSGAFFSAAERGLADTNGVRGPASGPHLTAQPVQGF